MPSKLVLSLRVTLVCLMSLFSTVSWAQTVRQVGPGQPYTTIQAGINAAVNGDTVLVAPGTYYENIDFMGKAITVTSSGGAAVTTIDGGNKPGLATVIFVTNETSASILSGFTITGGGDTIFGGSSDGGVFVSGYSTPVSPTIQNNIITGNYCHNVDVEFSTPTIINNEISGVLQGTTGSYCTFGSGVHLQGTNNSAVRGPVVTGNTIENNLTGSGVNIWASQRALIFNNIIRHNKSPDPGSAFISVNDTGTVFVQNLVYGNTSTCGGAIAFMDGGTTSNPGILIANNTIVDNVTPLSNSGSECTPISQIYPAPYSYGSSSPGALIVNNIISRSTSYPAVNCSQFSAPSEANQPTFQNNILYNAGGPFFGSLCIDVSHKYNNIVADPQFVSPSTGDYHLKITSPAIDSGQNAALQTFLTMAGRSLSSDFDGNPRVQNALGGNCTIDMGAFEYPGNQTACSITETLQSSLNPSSYGQSVTFTATLTSANGVPTGSVQFMDGASVLSTQVVSSAGTAAYSISTLSVGAHPITAVYQPTGAFGSASASLSQVVNGQSTTTGLTCNPGSINAGGTALFSVSASSAGGTPTGSFSFTDNGAALTQVPAVNGAASYNYIGVASGAHTIVATLVPTGAFAGSSASCVETVTALPTTSVLMVTPTNTSFGSPVKLTATVSPTTPPGPITPTGTVSFYNGTVSLGTVILMNGVANLTLSSLPGGTDNLTCTYSGSNTYAVSNCNTVPVTVNAVTANLSLGSSANPAYGETPVTFTANLSSSGGPAAGNSVVISVYAGATLMGQSTAVTDANGNAVYNSAGLAPGTYTVSAMFAGSASLQSASSNVLTEQVILAPTATTLTVSPNPAYVGQTVTLVATVRSTVTSPLTPSGPVFFLDGTTLLGSAPANGLGVATLTISTLSVGSHPLSASSSTTFAFSGSGSNTVNEVVVASGFTIALAPATVTIARYGAGVSTVQLTSVGNFSGPLVLRYGALPQYGSASLAPATVTLAAGGVASSTLTVNSLVLVKDAVPTRPGVVASRVFYAGGVMLLLPLAFARRRWLRRAIALLVIGAACQGLTGCTNAYYDLHFVAAGTYTLPVTATDSQGNTQTANLSVVITP